MKLAQLHESQLLTEGFWSGVWNSIFGVSEIVAGLTGSTFLIPYNALKLLKHTKNVAGYKMLGAYFADLQGGVAYKLKDKPSDTPSDARPKNRQMGVLGSEIKDEQGRFRGYRDWEEEQREGMQDSWEGIKWPIKTTADGVRRLFKELFNLVDASIISFKEVLAVLKDVSLALYNLVIRSVKR